MPFLRYRVDDVPVRGAGAFTPGLVTTPVASSYGLVHVFGAPGTAPIPAPDPGMPVASKDPRTSSSVVSPDVWAPAVYVPSARNMHGPVMIRHNEEMPVPARGWQRVARPAMDGNHIGGRRVIPWPRTFQRFPSRTGTPDG